MHMYIKIGGTGEQLPETATVWDAALDTSTNLMLEANLSDKKYKWNDINQRAAEVNQVGLCGHRDWRVPNIDELKSLVKKGAGSPSIDAAYFPNTPASYFWSSSPDADFSSFAWSINFYNGSDGNSYKYSAEYVRLVRTQRVAREPLLP